MGFRSRERERADRYSWFLLQKACSPLLPRVGFPLEDVSLARITEPLSADTVLETLADVFAGEANAFRRR